MSSKIEIWDRKSDLNGIDKSVWLSSYPRAEKETLILIDGIEVVFLEDLKKNFKGNTVEDIVKAYIEQSKKDNIEAEKRRKENEEKNKTEIEKIGQLVKENVKKTEKNEGRLNTLSSTIEELILNQ
ncbi:MAG: hypothetical protein ACTTIQ_06730 [Peptostreptococcus stomatis]